MNKGAYYIFLLLVNFIFISANAAEVENKKIEVVPINIEQCREIAKDVMTKFGNKITKSNIAIHSFKLDGAANPADVEPEGAYKFNNSQSFYDLKGQVCDISFSAKNYEILRREDIGISVPGTDARSIILADGCAGGESGFNGKDFICNVSEFRGDHCCDDEEKRCNNPTWYYKVSCFKKPDEFKSPTN